MAHIGYNMCTCGVTDMYIYTFIQRGSGEHIRQTIHVNDITIICDHINTTSFCVHEK